MRKKRYRQIFFVLLSLISGVLFIDYAGEFLFVSWARHDFFDGAKIVLPFILFIAHSVYFLSWRRSILFLCVCCLGGYAAESIGLSGGALFGSEYRYVADSCLVFSRIPLFHPRFFINGIPLLVIVYWGIFIYAGYSMSNAFLCWRNKEKPSIKNEKLLRLGKLVFVDTVIVLAIDSILDPLLVSLGNWQWSDHGAYFGIPMGNFLGWAVVSMVVSGCFRSFEYFFPASTRVHDAFLAFVPVVSLMAFNIFAVWVALAEKIYQLIPVVVGVMFPILWANVFSFLSSECGRSVCKRFFRGTIVGNSISRELTAASCNK